MDWCIFSSVTFWHFSLKIQTILRKKLKIATFTKAPFMVKSTCKMADDVEPSKFLKFWISNAVVAFAQSTQRELFWLWGFLNVQEINWSSLGFSSFPRADKVPINRINWLGRLPSLPNRADKFNSGKSSSATWGRTNLKLSLDQPVKQSTQKLTN